MVSMISGKVGKENLHGKAGHCLGSFLEAIPTERRMPCEWAPGNPRKVEDGAHGVRANTGSTDAARARDLRITFEGDTGWLEHPDARRLIIAPGRSEEGRSLGGWKS